MRFKHLLASLALSLTVGVGIFAGVKAHSEVKEASAAPDTYTLVGSFNGDNSWNVSDTTKDLTDSDGDGVYTINFSMNASTNTEFKIAVNHAWDTSYGFNEFCSLKAKSDGVWSHWQSGTNIGIWSKTAITVTIYFRASDHAIFVTDQGKLSSFKTYYFVLPSSGQDKDNANWSTWGNPLIYWWGTGFDVSWDNSSSMKNESRTYKHGDTTGALYSFNIPSNSNLIVRNSGGTKQTEDFSLESSTNMIHPYVSDSKNILYGDGTPILANGAYLRGDWTNGWTHIGQKNMTSSSSSGPFSIEGVNLSAGSAVKALYINNGDEQWCQFNSVSSNDDDHYPVITVDDNNGGFNAGVQSTGSYNLTVTKNANGKWDYAFTGTANTDLDAAVAFANTFVSTMYSECPYNHTTSSYNTGKTASTLATAWSSQISAYSSLDDNAKPYLLDQDSNITAITTFFGVYDYVYGHYSNVRAVTNSDFLSRNPATTPTNTINPLSNNGGESGSLIIVVVTSLSLIALGGFLFLKKKKEI